MDLIFHILRRLYTANILEHTTVDLRMRASLLAYRKSPPENAATSILVSLSLAVAQGYTHNNRSAHLSLKPLTSYNFLSHVRIELY